MKSLRNASSLILTAPSIVAKNLSNHEGVSLLAIKRAATSTHFPNAYAFPGGNVDPADQVSEWMSVLPPDELDVHMNIVGEKHSPSDSLDCPVSPTISLRITAIRETFEECGILLCKRKEEKLSLKVSHFNLEDTNSWRKKIQDDPREFLNLCQMYNCFPNIKGLYFFNNWITPTRFLRRYDCKFFVAVLDHQVQGEADGLEIETIEVTFCLDTFFLRIWLLLSRTNFDFDFSVFQWHPINYFLESNHVFLPPPQLYVMNMLSKFKDLSHLREFAMSMNTHECEPLTPTLLNLTNGMVVLLPGKGR